MKTILKKLLLLTLLLPISALSQDVLTGNVLDGNNSKPLPGVNVNIKNSPGGVSTDFDGSFKIANIKIGDVVVFSYIGYKTEIITYSGQKNVKIYLNDEQNSLKEVVVQVGYGSVKKKDATGSVTTLTAKDFNKGPVVAVDQMIQGKIAGVQITSNGGSPGDGATIRIRQGSSLNASNDPLYVIDGVPVDPGIEGGKNPLATINQNDIESVTILKDASATAIYGSKASNGVVIITTKKGKSGDLQIGYNGSFSVSTVAKTVDNLSSDQFRTYVNANGNAAQKALIGTSNTDWQKEIYRIAKGTDHNITLSGGSEMLVYRASVGFTDMSGLLLKDNFNRTTLGINLIGKFFGNHLKIELNNKTAVIKNDYSNKDAIGGAVSYDPTQSIYNADGSFRQWNYSSAPLAAANPLSLINQKTNLGNSTRSIGNIQTEYKLHFFPDLKLVANLGYDYQSGRSFGNTSRDFYIVGEQGNSYLNTEEKKNILMDLYVNYKKDLKIIKGSVEFTGGYSYQNFDRKYLKTSTVFSTGVLTNGISLREIVNLQSVFGRAIFNIADKYILTASIRRDQSSRFTEEFRTSYFPSAALAWKIKDESFVKNITSISNLKLRLGWGITGQQAIQSVYPSIPLYLSSTSTAQYPFGNTYYTTVRPLPYNKNLKWEQTETRNIGLDFGFYNNRVNGSIDLYEKRTTDLLLYAPNPSFFGFSNYDNYNIASTKNQGIEISAEVIPVKTNDLTWSIGGNITLQNSKITELIPGANSIGFPSGDGINGGIGNQVQQNQVGYAPNSFFVFEQAYNASGQPISGVFIDRNGNGTIDDGDKYFFHRPTADIFYGFFSNLSYKNWDASMSWRGSWNNYVYNNVDSNFGWQGQVLVRNTDLANGVTNLLETNFTTASAERYLSDYYVQKASFIRLDNVTIGYNFKKLFDNKVNAKLSLGGQNLLIITPYKGIDPEISNGIDKNIYPRPRMFTLGLNVNF
jgi:TonB-dependent starch-binding outer membrane protein SusC